MVRKRQLAVKFTEALQSDEARISTIIAEASNENTNEQADTIMDSKSEFSVKKYTEGKPDNKKDSEGEPDPKKYSDSKFDSNKSPEVESAHISPKQGDIDFSARQLLMAHIPTLKELIFIYETQFNATKDALKNISSINVEQGDRTQNMETYINFLADSTNTPTRPLHFNLKSFFGSGDTASNSNQQCESKIDVIRNTKVKDRIATVIGIDGSEETLPLNNLESLKLTNEDIRSSGTEGRTDCINNNSGSGEGCPNLPFYCSACCRNYNSRRLLYFHNRQVHDIKTIACSECGKPLKNRAAYIKHRRRHLGTTELAHVCPSCGKRCKERRHLLVHCKNKKHLLPENKISLDFSKDLDTVNNGFSKNSTSNDNVEPAENNVGTSDADSFDADTEVTRDIKVEDNVETGGEHV